MSIFKCKMCGGTLEIDSATVATCEYCGTQQTLPKTSDDVTTNLFNRANNLRLKCEFDKAAQIYEKIVQKDDSEAEAHWGLVLCKYGIEYVEDPKTLTRIPTCHRTLFEAVTTDPDYIAAIDYSDAAQQAIYEREARAIDRIQKDILAIVKNEKPFDVFLCYKESDANGKRTVDSVIANDIYHQLTQEGFKVFYAAITLEDKLGQEYEPYIFAALNSAKVMLALGTKPEYFSAVWVKNEWSRFMQLMKTDRSKLLIPCYRDMDAYDLPEEFSHLQAQDMGKIGFINDVVRGIRKLIAADVPQEPTRQETKPVAATSGTAPLLKRVFMFLEDGDWNSADEYCEKILDLDPECAEAYIGKLMAELKVRKQENLKDQAEAFNSRNNYQKAIRFADETLRTALVGYIEYINHRNETAHFESIYAKAKNATTIATSEKYTEAAHLFESISEYRDSAALAKECYIKAEVARKDSIYIHAQNAMSSANAESAYKEAAQLFESISEYRDSDALAKECYIKAEVARKDTILTAGKAKMTGEIVFNYEAAIKLLESISGWKDADEEVYACQKKIEEINAKAEAQRLERERKAEIVRMEAAHIAKRNKKIATIVSAIIALILAFIIVLNTVIIPNGKYNDAIALMNEGKYEEAIAAFEALDGYRDSDSRINECKTVILDSKYNDAVALMDAGKYEEAITAFEALDGHRDSDSKTKECETAILDSKYNDAVALMDTGKYEEAISAFETFSGYKDSTVKINECNAAIIESKYNDAIALMDAGNIVKAYEALVALEGYKDSTDKASSIYVKYKLKTAKAGDYVFFGAYEQDNNVSNEKEAIEWLVLEVKDGKALVISKYALDCKPYNTSYTDVTWETCTLRKWLNNDFINSAFSVDESAMIPTVTVSADKNPRYNLSISPGNATQDQVFLLSITDAGRYFYFDSKRPCKPTDYAVANGAYVDSNSGNCHWWLRTPGGYQSNAACVVSNGLIPKWGDPVYDVNIAVRPALWIDLSAVQ